MKNNGEHIVEKLIVEVTTASSRQGYAIKDNARSFIDRCIVPAIEQYIAELEAGMDPDQIVQIDRLSIDIDSSTSDLESSELEFAVRQEFEKAMQRTLEEIETLQQTVAAKAKKTQVVASTVADLPEFSDKPNIQTPSPEMHRIAGLFYFLEHGTRPWWSKDAGQFNALLEERSLLEIITAEKTVFIRNLLAKGNSRTVRKRLIRQFSDDFLAQVLALVGEKQSPAAAQLQQAVSRYFSRQQSVAVFSRETLWQTIIQAVLLERRGQQVPDRALARELLKHVQPSAETISNEPSVLKAIKGTLQAALELVHAIAGTTVTKQQYETVLQQIHRNEQGNWIIADTEARPETSGIADRTTEQQQRPQNAPANEEEAIHLESPGIRLDAAGNPINPDGKTEDSEQELIQKQENLIGKEEQLSKEKHLSKEKEKEQPAEQELFEDASIDEPALQLNELIVDNAGLILLHPFLKYFFSAVGVLEGDMLTDLPLAAHLLHYIATGRECDYEHSMLLEKYLVGIPLDQSIERNMPISDAIKEEIEGLLNGFKQNWPKMSGSSNDAVRETFLQRQGKLLDESPQPRLVVERKTLDILLEELDWTISIVRFPWMKTILFVEW